VKAWDLLYDAISCYGRNDLRAKIEPPSCRQYKPSDFLAVTPLNWDWIIKGDDDNENWAHTGPPSVGRSRLGDVNGNGNGEGEENALRGETGTWKRKGTRDGNWNRKWKGKGNCKGKDIVKQTPGGDDISRAVALQLENEKYEPDTDTEG
jgi:hypothetical protein